MRRRLLAVALACVLALAACGGDDGGGDANDKADDALANLGPQDVGMKNVKFVPGTLTVKVGDKVTWHFTDGSVVHNVTGDGWKSENMSKGVFEHTFDQPGTYDYACTLHPTMKGSVTVEA